MSAVGGRPREIRLPTESSIQGQYSLPQWSTDGSEIAVAVRRLTGKAIAIVSLESLETRHVSIPPQEGPFSADLSWSPDGQTFAYVDSAGGEMTQLTTDPTPDWTPRWSPDGTEIAFHAYRSGNREIWVMPSNGGPARQLTTHPMADTAPSWSSDGREIAFTSSRGGDRDLWIVDAGGGEPRLLADGGAYAEWSPDGSSIVFARNLELWQMPASGGQEERISAGPGLVPQWSPDGKLLYYLGSLEHSGRLWALSPSDGQEVVIADLRGRRGSMKWLSTDGAYLYFTWEQDLGDIWVMDVVCDE